jgi:mono/diheme cytochrome c family protein
MMLRFATAAVVASLLVSTGALAETPAERGSYLVNTIMACGNCHTPKDANGLPIADKNLSGGLTFDTPAFLATASNITQDKETGIGAWSDADIKRLITEGVRPNGVPVAAVMAVNFYKALTPGDLDAIVAYLRTVLAVKNQVPASTYKLPVRRDVYPDAEKPYTEAALKDPVTHGRYLATIGHCMECHSEQTRGVSNFTTGFGKGGRDFLPAQVKGFPASWAGAKAANITSSKTSGIGGWSDAEIKRAITKGIDKDGHTFPPPMAVNWYARMKDGDVNDIVAWLRTVPAVD